MEPFRTLTAPACALAMANIDTDQLIPARFMKRSRAEGYGQYLLHDLRFDEGGLPRTGFPLNGPGAADARILVTRRNFGGGSSREAAVYALVDFGIRCVIAPNFGDIFASNAVNNGLLPAQVSEADAERLLGHLAHIRPLTIDLEGQMVQAAEMSIAFAIDPVWRLKLLNGWDDIDLTLAQGDAIAAFVSSDNLKRPWAAPSQTRG